MVGALPGPDEVSCHLDLNFVLLLELAARHLVDEVVLLALALDGRRERQTPTDRTVGRLSAEGCVRKN